MCRARAADEAADEAELGEQAEFLVSSIGSLFSEKKSGVHRSGESGCGSTNASSSVPSGRRPGGESSLAASPSLSASSCLMILNATRQPSFSETSSQAVSEK